MIEIEKTLQALQDVMTKLHRVRPRAHHIVNLIQIIGDEKRNGPDKGNSALIIEVNHRLTHLCKKEERFDLAVKVLEKMMRMIGSHFKFLKKRSSKTTHKLQAFKSTIILLTLNQLCDDMDPFITEVNAVIQPLYRNFETMHEDTYNQIEASCISRIDDLEEVLNDTDLNITNRHQETEHVLAQNNIFFDQTLFNSTHSPSEQPYIIARKKIIWHSFRFLTIASHESIRLIESQENKAHQECNLEAINKNESHVTKWVNNIFSLFQTPIPETKSYNKLEMITNSKVILIELLEVYDQIEKIMSADSIMTNDFISELTRLIDAVAVTIKIEKEANLFKNKINDIEKQLLNSASQIPYNDQSLNRMESEGNNEKRMIDRNRIIKHLIVYIDRQKKYQRPKGNIFSPSRDNTIQVAKKALDQCSGISTESLTPNDIQTLAQGELQKILTEAGVPIGLLNSAQEYPDSFSKFLINIDEFEAANHPTKFHHTSR